jgi:hypothetical protein
MAAGVNQCLTAVKHRLTGIETRLDEKAGTWVVYLWGITLSLLIGAALALVQLWP